MKPSLMLLIAAAVSAAAASITVAPREYRTFSNGGYYFSTSACVPVTTIELKKTYAITIPDSTTPPTVATTEPISTLEADY